MCRATRKTPLGAFVRASHVGRLDLLRQGDGSLEAIRFDIQATCAVAVASNAVILHADTLRIEPIPAENEHAGTRVAMLARWVRRT